jgi:hypothetical protein
MPAVMNATDGVSLAMIASVTDDDQTVTQTRQDAGLDRETQGRISSHLY